MRDIIELFIFLSLAFNKTPNETLHIQKKHTMSKYYTPYPTTKKLHATKLQTYEWVIRKSYHFEENENKIWNKLVKNSLEAIESKRREINRIIKTKPYERGQQNSLLHLYLILTLIFGSIICSVLKILRRKFYVLPQKILCINTETKKTERKKNLMSQNDTNGHSSSTLNLFKWMVFFSRFEIINMKCSRHFDWS